MAGFTGFGTLGGGVTSPSLPQAMPASLHRREGTWRPPRRAVRRWSWRWAAPGVVDASGKLTLTGGGDLQIKIGGALNPKLDAVQFASSRRSLQQPEYRPQWHLQHNLRGLTDPVGGGGRRRQSAVIASIRPRYAGSMATLWMSVPVDPFKSSVANSQGGIELLPGDSAIYLNTSGDLVLGTASDPGRRALHHALRSSRPAARRRSAGSWFSLWSDHTGHQSGNVGRRQPDAGRTDAVNRNCNS